MKILLEIIYYFTSFCDTRTKFECSLVSKEWKSNIQWNSYDRSYIMLKKFVRNWVTVKRKTNYIKKSGTLIILSEPDNSDYFKKKNLKYLIAVSHVQQMQLSPEFIYEYKGYLIETRDHIISSFTIFGKNITKVCLYVSHTAVSSKFFLRKEGFCYNTFVPFEFGIPVISMRYCDIHLVFNNDADIKSISYKSFCLNRKDIDVFRNEQMIIYPFIKYENFALFSEFRTNGGFAGLGYDSKYMETRDICERFFDDNSGDEKLQKFVDENWRRIRKTSRD